MATGPHPPDEPADDPAAGGGSGDVEARWREIVARLSDIDRETPDDVDAGDGPGETTRPDDVAASPSPPRAPEQPAAPDGLTPPPPPTGPRAWSPDPALEAAEDHFEHPDPGPVLGGDPLLTMAWVIAVAVPVLGILVGVLWRGAPTALLQVAGGLFLLAVGTLVWRMPHHRDDDEGPGAVV